VPECPTTEHVRNAYVLEAVDHVHPDKAYAEFDRWLRSVKAEAWAEGVEAGRPTRTSNPYLKEPTNG